jgi:histidinol-phosphate/aromatic aminotransferase/cobyric acid decarboxylase-like protein
MEPQNPSPAYIEKAKSLANDVAQSLLAKSFIHFPKRYEYDVLEPHARIALQLQREEQALAEWLQKVTLLRRFGTLSQDQ